MSTESVEYYPPIASVRCKCGVAVKVLTSHTDENPYRRFGICNVLDGGCNFWRWLEPDDISAKAKSLIKRLKCQKQHVEEELRKANASVEPVTHKMVEKVLEVEELNKENGCLKEKNLKLEFELAAARGASAKWRNIAIICIILIAAKLVGL